jgi:hypothetical protein
VIIQLNPMKWFPANAVSVLENPVVTSLQQSKPAQAVEMNMSVKNVIADLKSFGSKVEAAFKKLFGDAPDWIKIAQGVLTYLGPIVVTILTVGGGAALGDEANAIIATIKTDLATALAALTTADAATSVPTLLTGIQAQLPSLLAAVKVSNPSSVANVENYTSIIDTELTALINAIPAATAPVTA